MEKNKPKGLMPLIRIMAMAMGSKVPRSPKEPACSIRSNLKRSGIRLSINNNLFKRIYLQNFLGYLLPLGQSFLIDPVMDKIAAFFRDNHIRIPQNAQVLGYRSR